VNNLSRTTSPARPNRTRPTRLTRILVVACTSLAVLVAVLAVMTGADVVPADARSNPVELFVSFDGVAFPATNYTDSTVVLCPQAATVRMRFRNSITGRPFSHRRFTVYWTTDGSQWRSSRGRTTRVGLAARRMPGRLTGVQIAASGYNHYFAVRYRSCRTSVARVRISRPYGVHGDRRAHVSIRGRLYARRANGVVIPFARGRVEIRDNRTRGRITTLWSSASGTFAASVPVPASTRLTLIPVGGPTGSVRRVAYGREWEPKPMRTVVVRIPSWMRRHVRYDATSGFAPRLRNFTGGFADPTVMRVGRTYYAASTTGSDLNLPLMTSRNLVDWRPHAALRNYYDYSSWPDYNEAMTHAPAWAVRVQTRENVKRISQWAPSLARVGNRRYVAAFSAATKVTNGNDRHSCIGLAVAKAPAGPYWALDKPLLCDPSTEFGVIDPDVFVDPRTHRKYLVWAAEGIRGRRRVQLAIRQLDSAGTSWARGSRRHDLLTFSQRWEGVIMENPSMIRYHGTLYLFYSANAYATSRYATGYAICRTVAGPCFKPRRRPLLATRGSIAGPGGADAFIDVRGHLRLAYAAWRRGHAGQAAPGRTLHIATLGRNPRNGRLTVRRLTL